MNLDALQLETILNLENIGEAQKKEVLDLARQSVLKKILIRSLGMLNEEQKDMLIKQLEEEGDDRADDAKVLAFLRDSIDGFDEMVAEEIESFRKESADFIATLQNADTEKE